MNSHTFIVLFLLLLLNTASMIVVSANSNSRNNRATRATRATRKLNSKIASLIKQSSITINSYGLTATGGHKAVHHCTSDNVRSVLSRVHNGGASAATATATTTSSSSLSNTTANGLESSYEYDDLVRSGTTGDSASASASNNGTVLLTSTVSSGNTANTSESGIESENAMDVMSPIEERKLKVLFLSADTGGGHRASAESLASQFLKHYPGIEYELIDVWTPTQVYPYKTLVKSYKHLSAHPRQWRLLYYISNTKWYEFLTDKHSHKFCRQKIEKQIEATNPDIVISVHPTMNFVPERAVRNIGEKRGKYIPFFTVVTDFGSAHCTWFQKNVDMIYVASKRILKLAKRRGNLKDDKIVKSGLPIREDFAIQAEKMGDRTTVQGKEYRKSMKSALNIDPNKKTILLMGGGEGVGSLSKIAGELRRQLTNQGVDATILVVCGRNEKLKNELNGKDWDAVEAKVQKGKKKIAKRRKQNRGDVLPTKESVKKGDVEVIGLGFITNMADYMVAADVLVSKAGPGTIAEAAALGLPVMITSFLPGQEAGNVNIVLDGGFGAFHKRPRRIASIVSEWMQDDFQLDEMSRNSMKTGNPTAASDIVQDIYNISMEKMNGKK